MGLFAGFVLGVGLFCVWWSCWTPSPPRERRTAAPVDRMRDVLTQAGMSSLSVRSLALACLIAATMVSIGVWSLSSAPAVAVCFGAMAGWTPLMLVRVRARRRRTRVRDLWPEAVDHLTSGIRAGLSLPESLAQLGDRGPAELRPAFQEFAEDYRATGAFSACLDLLKDRLADPVADRIVEALRLTREVGGTDLGRLLRTLSAFLREDARTRSELEARQSWTVNAARLAVCAPWIVLALLATRPEALLAYNRPAGVAVLAAGAGISLVAYRVMIRVGRLPDEERVLR